MIDLSETTFIIPVRLDSPDRLRNLTASVNYLQKHTKTNIFIVEQDVRPRVPESLATRTGVEYNFLLSTDVLFYKTLCINDAVAFVKTKNIVIYDTDALIPVGQLEKLQETLDSPDCAVVYPYDGRFLDIPESMVPSVISSLSVENVDPSACKAGLGMPEVTPDRQSFGGAVAFNREKFIEGGMANQHMVSYGPEDAEFYVRFKKLGFKIERLGGPIFHLHHQRGMNSGDNHSHTSKNHAEFKKINEMDSNVLKFFVSSWPWSRKLKK